MAVFRVFFEMDNEAFTPAPEDEASRILREISSKLDNGHREGHVRDGNGNTVGTWGIDKEGQ